MFVYDFRIWTGKEMIYFTLGDLMDQVVDIPSYLSEEMISSGIADEKSEIAYVGDIVEINDGEIMQVKFGEFKAHVGDDAGEFIGFYVENSEATTFFGKADKGYFKILGNVYENPELVKELDYDL